MRGFLMIFAAAAVFVVADGAGAGAARLVCYVESARAESFSECTHLVYTGDARGEKLDALLKDYRTNNPRLKIVLRVAEVDKDLRTLLKSKHIQGLEIINAHKALNKTKVLETIDDARKIISSSGGGPLFLALPASPELLAKYYDLRVLMKKVDLMMVQTHALGMVKKMTFHPSRLSGMWDMMNTDSVVDLVIGLGVPASKIVISLPATARQFTLINETLSTPGSPALDDEPKEISQAELCRQLQKGGWTLERDQDLSAPYAFKDKTWMSFEDSSSVDVKGKYARVRGLAGLALHKADLDLENPCGPTLKGTLGKVLNQQSRAPRAVVLRSLEHEILSAPNHQALEALQVSPYRITQVVDSDGVIHSIREDTRTEFSCSRQGYFVHPRSCARFYRCVKFDQLSPEYTVFEFDCPAGLAFDSRFEVCVWPGSLPHSQACPGSSEIAPVPKTRFVCPEHEGYYADPENCRWFFACLDHGSSPLTAYEFRCPFGLGFDAGRLTCDWPWLVPACGNIARYEAEVHGYSGALLSGAAGFHGQTADSVNIAAHNSLVSGAAIHNHVGIQGGFLTKDDALDGNFIASQELANQAYQVNGLETEQLANRGLVQATKYNDEEKYTSGSLILDDYRLPTNKVQAQGNNYVKGKYSNGYAGLTVSQNSGSDESGAYVHDPSGDYAVPYKHTDLPAEPYQHSGEAYKQSSDYYDYGRYSAQNNYNEQYDKSGQYTHDNSGSYNEGSANSGQFSGTYKEDSLGQLNAGYYNLGKYNADSANSGAYYETGSTNDGQYSENSNENRGQYVAHNEGQYYLDNSGAYKDDSGNYLAGVYRADGHIGENAGINAQTYHGSYGNANGNYISDSKAYHGSSHTLTAGAINVGLVGKTTLVDSNNNEGRYESLSDHDSGKSQSYSNNVIHQSGQLGYVSQPAVSISHVGTDSHNLDGYSFVTTPTSSGIPTTATPFAITTAIPTVTYKNTFVPEPPKTSIKQILGYSQPAVTTVQPAVIAVEQYPDIEIGGYNQGQEYQNKEYSSNSGESRGYVYQKPEIKFEDGVTHSTPTPITVSKYKPQGFSHGQQTIHKVESVGYENSKPLPAYEEPFKKVVAYTTGPELSYEQPTIATYIPQAYSHQTIHKEQTANGYESSGIAYEAPQTVIEYTTPQPAISIQPVAAVQPNYGSQGYSHQTFHKVDASSVHNQAEGYSGYQYNKPAINFEQDVKTVDYSTPAPAVVSTYKPQVYSQQTLHNVDSSQVKSYSEDSSVTGYEYAKPNIQFEETPIQYSAPTPAYYKPQTYNVQTVHLNSQNDVPVSSTPFPEVVYQRVSVYDNPLINYAQKVTPVTYVKPAQSYSSQTIHKVEGSGYEYKKPKIYTEYTTAQPAYQSTTSTYEPQVFSQQTIHKVDASQINSNSQANSGYHYSKPAVKYDEVPKTVYQYSTPAPVAVSTYEPQIYSQQTLHNVDTSQFNTYSQENSGYEYSKPVKKYEKVPETEYQYSTPAPAVVSTYKPQIYSHNTLHQVNVEGNSGYQYSKPAIKFEETPKTVYEYSTVAPIKTSYKPESYSHQTIHKIETQNYIPVSSTQTPKVEYQPAVSVYQNPILKYVQEEITPITYKKPADVYTQTYQQQVNHVSQPAQYEIKQNYEQNYHKNLGYTYDQPEIQTNIEVVKSEKAYSDASAVSHQVIHHSIENNQYDDNKKVVFISSTPATLVYEDHYADYETPKKIETYQAPEYIPPRNDYQQTQTVSSTSSPIVHKQPTFEVQDQYDYSQQYENTAPVQHVSFTTSHIEQPKRTESVHISTFPGTVATKTYNQVAYQSPEIQVGYNAEEYLPPVDSTVKPAYQPRVYSTTTSREYLPPAEPTYAAPDYLPPKVDNSYLPPKVDSTYLPPSTVKTYVKSTTQVPTYKYEETTSYKGSEYLPPVEPSVINFESFGYKNNNYNEGYISHVEDAQEAVVSSSKSPIPRKQNIVVKTSKSNLLGFGTVGPDAGLVRYTSVPGVVSTTESYSPKIVSTYTPEYVEVTSTIVPIRRTKQKLHRVKSTTSAPYVESTTTYKAPEYLPPSDDDVADFTIYGQKNIENPYQEYTASEESIISTTKRPKYRKQNIVIQTAKAQKLGYSTEEGLVSSTSAPVVSSSETYSLAPEVVSSTYLPLKQELVEITPSPVPARRNKQKVAVVTKLNDFNPFLVRKLGAVCSCQTPVLVLRGKRPNVRTKIQQDYDDYNSSEDFHRGDVSDDDDDEYSKLSARLQSPRRKVVTVAPRVTSTFNPIVVPDDSFYQDYEESDDSLKTDVIEIESSTPVVSTTERVVKIRPRVKAVTVRPTYKTVLLEENVAPASIVDSQSFDRYGPGGLRSRDETLQGSVDCKRAGLFRHPKQCNKFYACRWDCTKQRFTLHVFNCPVQLSFDPNIGACNWPSQGPSCQGDTLLTNAL